MKEAWKDIDGYDGDYQVSSLGGFRSWKNSLVEPQILKGSLKQNGRVYMSPCLNGKRKEIQISRLVAEYFIPNPENKPLVLHKDDDPLNNKVENLYWGDYQDNWKDRAKNGIRANVGEDHGMSLLTEVQVLEIRRKYACEDIRQSDLAKENGVCEGAIYDIIAQKTWKHLPDINAIARKETELATLQKEIA